GLVGYWDNVAFDEFAGISKRVDKNLVDTMKNYMANKSFSRGSTPYGATASFSFVGNTMHSLSYMMKHSDLFEALPKAYYDTAFLDRIHCYLPGWEVQKLRNELFTGGYGFIVDYLAEVLKDLRKDDYSHLCSQYFDLSEAITTRDRTGVLKTFSGLCKISYPHGECSQEEAKEILNFALEGRRRVKNQLVQM
ncbi:BREX system Lon protease-like protein BrxL, partial [Myroides odoratimimus]|uniref:BREX system Lon protease-like protein BrxL n=1 Tax=Myroides odoratimimus TaxID=76832 RepID=UPI0025755C8F